MGIFKSTPFSTVIRSKNGPFRETGIYVGPDSRYYVKHSGGYVPMTLGGDTGIVGLTWYGIYSADDERWAAVDGTLSYLYTPDTPNAKRSVRMVKGMQG
jgi:hypothetical protein